MTDEQVKVVKDWAVPTTTKEVESFLGFANYHREFVPKFAEIASPLYAITGKRQYKWESEQVNKVKNSKRLMKSNRNSAVHQFSHIFNQVNSLYWTKMPVTLLLQRNYNKSKTGRNDQ